MACEVGLYYVLHITKQRNKNALLRLLPGLGECGAAAGPAPPPGAAWVTVKGLASGGYPVGNRRSSASCFQTPSALGTVWGSPSHRAGRATSVILEARVCSPCAQTWERAPER